MSPRLPEGAPDEEAAEALGSTDISIDHCRAPKAAPVFLARSRTVRAGTAEAVHGEASLEPVDEPAQAGL
eukprot:5718520-Pyramimonas_sp.AAC.1